MSRLFLDDPPPFLVEHSIDEVEKDRKEVDACETARGKMDSIAERKGGERRRGREGRAAVEVELARGREKRSPAWVHLLRIFPSQDSAQMSRVISGIHTALRSGDHNLGRDARGRSRQAKGKRRDERRTGDEG